MIAERQRRGARAFTLLELLVVIGLISALSFLAIGILDNRRAAALQSAQGVMANLLVAARSKAAASNVPARLLVNFDPSSTAPSSRFLRHVVLQVQSGGVWRSVTDAYLPDGVYVVPGNGAVPNGLFAGADSRWKKIGGADLRSTIFQSDDAVSEAIVAANTESWLCFPLAAAGTTNSSGDLILAAGRRRAPGSYAAGESPVELVNPEEVRGLAISQYGVAALVNGRAGF